VAVPTLRALVRRAVEEGSLDAKASILPVLHARRDEVYCQLFEVDGRRISPMQEARAVEIGLLFEEVKQRDLMITGEAAPKLRSLAEQQQSSSSRMRFLAGPVAACSPVTVALEGVEAVSAGALSDPASLEPRYIKEFHPKATARVV
jgi:tRNA A37 threonylcarbamoyladenosine modification protein TsaB